MQPQTTLRNLIEHNKLRVTPEHSMTPGLFVVKGPKDKLEELTRFCNQHAYEGLYVTGSTLNHVGDGLRQITIATQDSHIMTISSRESKQANLFQHTLRELADISHHFCAIANA